MTVADVPHRKLEANPAQLGDLRSWLAYAGLYGFLVLYSIAYKYFLSNQLLNFRGDFLFVDDLRATDYWFVIFLTPLAILPIGSRVRSAGQYLVGLLDIFIFIPIPIVFLALLPSPQFWTVYAFLWTGIFISNALSQFELPVGMVQLQPRSFKRVLAIVLVFIGIELLVLARAGIHFVALADVAEARAETSIGTVGGYAIYSLCLWRARHGSRNLTPSGLADRLGNCWLCSLLRNFGNKDCGPRALLGHLFLSGQTILQRTHVAIHAASGSSVFGLGSCQLPHKR